MNWKLGIMGIFGLCLISTSVAHAATFQVGPNKQYTKPSDVADLVQDGDVVEIDAGTYRCDTGVRWWANDLTIRGVGGFAHMDADGCFIPGGKGIWNPKGRNFTIENIEFSGASVPDQNGTGIRYEGSGLFTVKKSYFHDNENGILYTSQNPDGEIVITHSEFANNGYGDGQSHNLYINQAKSLTFKYNYSHSASIGHLLKTRARENHIMYNRLTGEDGTQSYEIDVSNGGLAYIIGNIFHQGPGTDNSGIIAYAAEGANAGEQRLYVINNTVVNDLGSGNFVRLWDDGLIEAQITNNFVVGFSQNQLVNNTYGKTTLANNVTTSNPEFVNQGNYDYRLTANSPAIDAGINPGTGAGTSLTPTQQYVHSLDSESRTSQGTIDAGAYEFNGGGGRSSSGGGSSGSSSGGGSQFPNTIFSQGCYHRYHENASPLSGFGVAFNLFSSTKELVLKADCSSGIPKLQVGSGKSNQYIYKTGYAYDGNRWQPLSFSGPLVSQNWIRESTQTNLPFSNADLSDGWNYAVAYLCQYENNSWHCGCSDTTCSQGKWQLQGIRN